MMGQTERKITDMSLLEQWRDVAYGDGTTAKEKAKLWKDYFAKEKSIYEELLEDPGKVVEGTLKEFAEKWDTDIRTMTGFMDGISESLKKDFNVEKLTEKTKIRLDIDHEKLYRNMVKAKADWLYGLPQWNGIFDAEKQKALAKEQRMSGTVIKEKKIGRNDPCPCGSGKKYKFCCGKN